MNIYVPELMYALDSLSEHADWKNVYNVSGDDVCYCPICLGKVKLWNGQAPNKIYKKQRCFHHIDGSCSQESQVHFAYKNWLLEKGSKFKVGDKLYEVESTVVEKTIHTSFGDYRPDITIQTSCGKTFLVEVAYSSKKTNQYIYKWDEIGNDVLEIDVNEQMYTVVTNEIPSFKLIYSSETGECYIKRYTTQEYDDLITSRKIYWKRKDILEYKIKWEQLDWFWRELQNFYSNTSTMESVIESFIKMDSKDQKFVCTHLKGKHLNLKYALEKHYTDKDDLEEAHLKHISGVIKKINKEFGYSSSNKMDRTYLYREYNYVIFKIDHFNYRMEKARLYINDNTMEKDIYDYFYPIMKKYYENYTISKREKIEKVKIKLENDKKYYEAIIKPILFNLKNKINTCKNRMWIMDFSTSENCKSVVRIDIKLDNYWNARHHIEIDEIEVDDPQNYIQNMIYNMMYRLFNDGLVGDFNGTRRLLEVEER
nr:MAG TPA: competence protein [Caudoviricetes sp.]